jgi:hypothetical protein
VTAQELGVPENWESSFHYYFAYTLYELEAFSQAKREFIVCLQSGLPGPPLQYIYKMLALVSRKLGERDQAQLYEREAKSLD